MGFDDYGEKTAKEVSYSPFYELKALADNSEERRGAAARLYPKTKVVSLTDMAEDAELDAVIVAVPLESR
ncbi:MAG: hypothetical protein NTV38_04620 [Chloroflexi bacterium]|nr:hypothetical protein [Chloroflexota bacterium]